MADYYPLIAKAVAGLDKSTGEVRRTLYERARGALVTQLRGVVPALSESEITRERLALEEAIRKVEAEAARKSRFDSPPERKRSDRGETAEPPKNLAPQPPRPAAPPSNGNGGEEGTESSTLSGTAADLRRRNPAPPERSSLSNDGLQGFRNVVADAENLGDATAQGGRAAREANNQMPAPSPESDRLEPRLEPEGLRGRDRRPPAREPRRDAPREAPREAPPPPPPNRAARPAPRDTSRDGYGRDPTSREPPGRDTTAREPRRDRSPPPPPPRDRPPARNNARANLRDTDDFDSSPQMEPARADEFSAHDFANDFDAAPAAAPDFDFDAAQGRGRGRRRAEAMEPQARRQEAES